MMEKREGETMLTASDVLRDFDVTNATLYRLVKAGKLEAEVTKKKHLKRASYRFRLSDVERVLDRKTPQQSH